MLSSEEPRQVRPGCCPLDRQFFDQRTFRLVLRALLPAASLACEDMPLDIMLMFMRDREMPPGFRGDMGKAAAPYFHSKAPDASPPPTIQITHIERVIIKPPRRDDDES
jgi:hypothetical protein